MGLGIRPIKDQILTNFLAHLLGANRFKKYVEEKQVEGNYPSISDSRVREFKVPVPPLSIQLEIVEILDRFAKLEEYLETELELRTRQYRHYRDQIFAFDNEANLEWKTLGEVVTTIKTGKLNANAMVENGQYPFYTCDATPFKINTFAFDTEAIIVSGNGSQVGHINYYNGKFNAYQRTYILADCVENVSIGYILAYLKATLRPYIIQHSKKGSVPYITMPMLHNFKIPVPPLSSQERIVAILGKFDELTTNLTSGLPAEIKARRRQYEHYRDRLLTFQEAA